MPLSLNIGKDHTGQLWLGVQDSGTRKFEALALFISPGHSEMFIDFMESQGYLPIRVPTDDEYNQLLRGDS